MLEFLPLFVMLFSSGQENPVKLPCLILGSSKTNCQFKFNIVPFERVL